jgi:hypothetical protein
LPELDDGDDYPLTTAEKNVPHLWARYQADVPNQGRSHQARAAKSLDKVFAALAAIIMYYSELGVGPMVVRWTAVKQKVEAAVAGGPDSAVGYWLVHERS